MHQKIKTTDELIYLEKHYYGASLNWALDDAGATIGYQYSVRVFAPEDATLSIDKTEETESVCLFPKNLRITTSGCTTLSNQTHNAFVVTPLEHTLAVLPIESMRSGAAK